MKVKVNMQVEYYGGSHSVNNPYQAYIQQTNWWVTLFCPWADQRIDDLDDLQVWMACTFDVIDGNGGEYMLNPDGSFQLDESGIKIDQIKDGGARHQNGALNAALKNATTGWGAKVATGLGDGLSWLGVPSNYEPNLNDQKWTYLNDGADFHEYYDKNEFDFYIQY